MAVKLRLTRQGRKKAPFYYIVAADSRSPRDGKFIEKLGSYNPLTIPATIELDVERSYDWLMKGAQPTDTVSAILRFKGVMYKKHLEIGVKKGKLTQEEADTKLNELLDIKNAKVAARKSKISAEKSEFLKKVSGEAKAPKVIAAADEDRAAFQVEEEVSVVAEAPQAVAEAPIVEEVVAVESTPEAAIEEAPAVVEEVAVVEEAPVAEEVTAVEEAAPVVEEAPAVEEVATPEATEGDSETV
jgi:small subunit ribosomal protein S16